MALPRAISDYTPLILDTSKPSSSNTPPMFKFELGWLLRDSFLEMVRDVWASISNGEDMMRCWQLKIRRSRQHLRGWAKHTSGVNKKEKKELLDKLDTLDKKVETSLLSPQELDVKQCLNMRLCELLREEEIKWYQRSKAKHLLEGEANAKYFHLLVNGRHRKTRIFQLQDGDNIISGDEDLKDLKKHITTYYKGLFGRTEESTFTLDAGRTGGIPQVTKEDNISWYMSSRRRLDRLYSRWNIIRCRDRWFFG
jgi:hypothetical protein